MECLNTSGSLFRALARAILLFCIATWFCDTVFGPIGDFLQCYRICSTAASSSQPRTQLMCVAQKTVSIFLLAIAGRSWNHMAFAGGFTATQSAIFHTKMSLVLWRQFQKQFVAGHIQREQKHYSWTHTHTHTFDTQSIPYIISFGDVGSQISASAHCAILLSVHSSSSVLRRIHFSLKAFSGASVSPSASVFRSIEQDNLLCVY